MDKFEMREKMICVLFIIIYAMVPFLFIFFTPVGGEPVKKEHIILFIGIITIIIVNLIYGVRIYLKGD